MILNYKNYEIREKAWVRTVRKDVKNLFVSVNLSDCKAFVDIKTFIYV